jgi:hypothetical protein
VIQSEVNPMKKVRRSIRFRAKDFDSLIMGTSKSLREISSLKPRGDSRNLLFQITPRSVEGWTIELWSSKSLLQTVSWLILKSFFMNLNKEEWEILKVLSSVNDFWTEFVREIQDLSNLNSKSRIIYLGMVQRQFPTLFAKDTRRYLFSFIPRLTVGKKWTTKVRLPPKSYIGVGHSESGSFPSTLAWQEQMLSDGEDRKPERILRNLFTQFLYDPQTSYKGFPHIGSPLLGFLLFQK